MCLPLALGGRVHRANTHADLVQLRVELLERVGDRFCPCQTLEQRIRTQQIDEALEDVAVLDPPLLVLVRCDSLVGTPKTRVEASTPDIALRQALEPSGDGRECITRQRPS
ncbi:hypothetical protein PF008_g23670 [Phytophthora fragariae]|uniref:Uncharacterized protein n=1 Tax=Phytophthora fragariae TaxID=53985 RepID=A0A6G0QQR9_9STRA|nr:hypothetical protein PF008_g23670 [Phytophthora fragariae]